ncbi:hypothetical protein SCLCIDRAFT_1096641 [Scleroderma citrinum Foug A]|uniref:Uncharacterized protein n=1 Tax=Scleroderma citrinum Foug A TaxID=1036808 RepID=A0A0C2Z8Y2_9AGAM|nr:hypothetical protein SCLCIDRAFT_1096641 [Scleroderma citrinum Foug A]
MHMRFAPSLTSRHNFHHPSGATEHWGLSKPCYAPARLVIYNKYTVGATSWARVHVQGGRRNKKIIGEE